MEAMNLLCMWWVPQEAAGLLGKESWGSSLRPGWLDTACDWNASVITLSNQKIHVHLCDCSKQHSTILLLTLTASVIGLRVHFCDYVASMADPERRQRALFLFTKRCSS